MKKSLEAIVRLSKRVQDLQRAGLSDREIEEKCGADMAQLATEARSEESEAQKRAPFAEDDAPRGGTSVLNIKGLEACLARTPRNDEERELHQVCDRLHFARQMLAGDPTRQRRVEAMLRNAHPALRKALDT